MAMADKRERGREREKEKEKDESRGESLPARTSPLSFSDKKSGSR